MVTKKQYDANLKAKLALEFIMAKKSVVELSAKAQGSADKFT